MRYASMETRSPDENETFQLSKMLNDFNIEQNSSLNNKQLAHSILITDNQKLRWKKKKNQNKIQKHGNGTFIKW